MRSRASARKGKFPTGKGSELAARGARAGARGAADRDTRHGIERLRACAGKGGGGVRRGRILGQIAGRRGRLSGEGAKDGSARASGRVRGARLIAIYGVRLTGSADGAARGVKGGREVAKTGHIATRKGDFAAKTAVKRSRRGRGTGNRCVRRRLATRSLAGSEAGREGLRERQWPVGSGQWPAAGDRSGAGRLCEARRLVGVGRKGVDRHCSDRWRVARGQFPGVFVQRGESSKELGPV